MHGTSPFSFGSSELEKLYESNVECLCFYQLIDCGSSLLLMAFDASNCSPFSPQMDSSSGELLCILLIQIVGINEIRGLVDRF